MHIRELYDANYSGAVPVPLAWYANIYHHIRETLNNPLNYHKHTVL